jgi:hypothetical protein
MESKTKYTSTFFYFQSKHKPEQLWDFLVNPRNNSEFPVKSCSYNEIGSDFKLEKNNSWTEIHTGESCKGDIVKNTIKKVIPYQYFKTVRYQVGIKNTAIITLEKNATGTVITEQQKYALSFRKFSPLAIVSWIMLLTGLLTKFGFNPDDDIKWFANMEDTVTKSLQKFDLQNP